MPITSEKKSLSGAQKNLIALVLTAVICAVAAGVWFFVLKPSPAVAPVPKTAKTAAQKRQPAQTVGSRVDARTQPRAGQPTEKSQPGDQVKARLNSDATVGDLARMRGQKQLLQQQVKIAELEAELKKARNSILAAPVVPQPQEIILPPLDPPKKEKAEEKEDKPKRSTGPVVVSVQGVGNKLSATIRTSSGETVTVRHGQRFGDGILSVTRRSVMVRTGSTSRTIPFME
ncbi:type IV pilus biogenesis protein PilP [uncultured Desulfovibrio sp.]|uniref:type IV pilus biogenesis protein PilP n=1 Tax=uncultured Desulfovibrio sp. TaxID=167968 RepID=UPI0025D0F0B4|nr:type IV pilus biogenesis protein PilP [uncultured Desulfovibrio sp.]